MLVVAPTSNRLMNGHHYRHHEHHSNDYYAHKPPTMYRPQPESKPHLRQFTDHRRYNDLSATDDMNNHALNPGGG